MDAESSLNQLRGEWSDLLDERIEHERTVGICEYTIVNAKERLVRLEEMMESSDEQKRRFEGRVRDLRDKLKAGPTTLDDYFDLFVELEESQSRTYDAWRKEFASQKAEIENDIEGLSTQLSGSEAEIGKVTEAMEVLRIRIDDTNDQYVEGRIQLALLKDRRGHLRRRIEEIKASIDRTRRDLNDAEAEALIKGQRVETGRTSDDILGEIRKTSGILMGLSDVPENAEEMYDSYSRTFKELQERVEQVRENRRKVMGEIDERTRKWAQVVRDLMEEVNARYQSLLAKLQASGEVRVINSTDIEAAGVEIYVSFKGGKLSRLDPYTHSGGERSTAIMAFLLALQQNVLSPFRAVDEFDLHMDPKNKEIVSEFIVSTMEGSHDQYMAITPSQVTFRGKDIHIIMVHKTEDISTVRVVEEDEG